MHEDLQQGIWVVTSWQHDYSAETVATPLISY